MRNLLSGVFLYGLVFAATNGPALSFDWVYEYAGFNGASSYGVAENTGIGSGDFYYEWAGTHQGVENNARFFGEGNSTQGIYGYFNDGNREVDLSIRYSVSAQTLKVYREFSAGDKLRIIAKREGSTVTLTVSNISKGWIESDNMDCSEDYSNILPMYLGRIGAAHAPGECFYFKVGTSATNIMHSYFFDEVLGGTVTDRVGTNDLTLIDVGIVIGTNSPVAVKVGWETETGQTYRVQSCADLLASDWGFLCDPIDGSGNITNTVDVVVGNKRRFYRVVE